MKYYVMFIKLWQAVEYIWYADQVYDQDMPNCDESEYNFLAQVSHVLFLSIVKCPKISLSTAA